eukprot:TRINITY_DN115724_c0_g1_i1.p1 TRINITY_DN115724_c0_g1~~TRINITY_DN115724_c0_g1_i1.p1  ORF type:complete len:341 (-),score=42.92 TRINITY_DN115724_c0_g1_i1:87-1109(-)
MAPLGELSRDAIGGQQLSSLRPSSARYSFAREARHTVDVGDPDSPGPGLYVYADALKEASAATICGLQKRDNFVRPYQYPEIQENLDEPVPDSARLRFRAPAGTIFGTEARFTADGTPAYCDPSLVKNCPGSRLGREGPGPAYHPDHWKARPSSAPTYSMGRARHSRTPQQHGIGDRIGSSRENSVLGSARGVAGGGQPVQPMSARSARSSSCHSERTLEADRRSTIGRPQVESRRRTGRASSFGTSCRFGPVKQATNSSSDDQYVADSSFGAHARAASRSNSRRRVGSAATFGRGTRDVRSRLTDTPPPADQVMRPPRLPHPVIPPQKEILRYNEAPRP